MRTVATVFFLLYSTISFSQVKGIDLCSDKLPKDSLIGKKVKVFQGYDYLSYIDFEIYGIKNNSPIKKLINQGSHENKMSLLKDGAIGTIAYVSAIPLLFFKDGSGGFESRFYVIKIEDEYIPIDCRWLIDISEPDVIELNEKWDSIYVAYPTDCLFSFDNGSWIENYSTHFACELRNQSIDTILYAKQTFLSHHSRKINTAIVLWYQNGEGFLKAFYDEGLRQGIQESEIHPLDWQFILSEYLAGQSLPKTEDEEKALLKVEYDVKLFSAGDTKTSIYTIDRSEEPETEENKLSFYLERIFTIVN